MEIEKEVLCIDYKTTNEVQQQISSTCKANIPNCRAVSKTSNLLA
jgi:hypothetical protein